MTPNSGWVQDAVMQVQSAYLDHPALSLTRSQAARRFGFDEVACEAILAALAETGVLARSEDGSYVRFFPAVGSPRFAIDGHQHRSHSPTHRAA